MNPTLRFLILIGATLWSLVPEASAQTTRAELLFALGSAAKVRNVQALERCFNFEGVTAPQAASIRRAIDQIALWPSAHIFTSERAPGDPLEIQKAGRTFVLNGEWKFQIHVHRGPPPSKGFVFPAGRLPSGEYRILLTAEKGAE